MIAVISATFHLSLLSMIAPQPLPYRRYPPPIVVRYGTRTVLRRQPLEAREVAAIHVYEVVDELHGILSSGSSP